MTFALRTQARRIAAILIVVSLYFISQPPALSSRQRAELAAGFRFERHELPVVGGFPQQTVRRVHPQLERISAWTSAVGGSVALSDLEHTGLPNDICHVDTRTDQVIVAPLPSRSGSADTLMRFKPFVLDPTGVLPFDHKTMAPMGCLPGNFAATGFMDILVYYWGRTPVIFVRKPPADVLHPHPLSAADFTPMELMPMGLDGNPDRWFTNAALQADLDGDGHVDLLLGNYHPDGARVLDSNATTPAEMQDSMSHAFNGGRKHFLLWQKPVNGKPFQYQEVQPTIGNSDDPFSVADSEKMLRGWTLALGAADLDGDLLPEIYIANDFGPDRLLYNRSTPGHLRFVPLEGVRHFTTPKSKVLGHDSFKGMGVDFADINRTGRLDLFVSNIAETFALQESHFAFINTGDIASMKSGIAPFEDQSEEMGLSRSGWGWDAKFGDFNNDGNLELIQATGFCKGNADVWPWLHELATANDALLKEPRSWPRFQPGDGLSGNDTLAFFAQDSSGHFWNIGRDIGFTEPWINRSIATADVEGDGRLDFAVANQFDRSYFFYNSSPNIGNFLGLDLLLPLAPTGSDRSNVVDRFDPQRLGRPAIGATVILHLKNGQSIIQQVDGGNGHGGKRSPDLHFGLGDLPAGESVDAEIHWRDGDGAIRSERLPLRSGRWHTIYLAWPGKESYARGD